MMTWNHENNLLNANADVVFHVGANFYSCILYRMNGGRIERLGCGSYWRIWSTSFLILIFKTFFVALVFGRGHAVSSCSYLM